MSLSFKIRFLMKAKSRLWMAFSSFTTARSRYGEFYELEDLLVKKGVPFDRESGMDWNAPPAIRIYRPGPPVFDHTDSTPDSYDEVVSVSELRERLWP